MLVGVLDSERRVVYRSTAPSHGLRQEELLETLERELLAAREACPDVVAAGLGIPCTIDRQRGVAIVAVNLELADVPIRELMTERLGLPVLIDNDANVAILAEHRFGAARGARNAVMLTIGTGIGGGLIVDGRLYRGSTGAGAELGHTVIDFDGPRCQGNCPNRGCVETLASGTAIAREGLAAAEADPDSALGRALAEGAELDGKEVTDAALAGDETARAVLAADREAARGRLLQPRQHLRPGRDRDRRRGEQGGGAAGRAGPRGARLPSPAADERDAGDDRRARAGGGDDRGRDDGSAGARGEDLEAGGVGWPDG